MIGGSSYPLLLSYICSKIYFSVLHKLVLLVRHWVRTQNIRKTNISYPLIRTPTCAYQKSWMIPLSYRRNVEVTPFFNQFVDNIPILYPLKKRKIENIWFSGIFEWHKMDALATNVSNLLLSHIIFGLSWVIRKRILWQICSFHQSSKSL